MGFSASAPVPASGSLYLFSPVCLHPPIIAVIAVIDIIAVVAVVAVVAVIDIIAAVAVIDIIAAVAVTKTYIAAYFTVCAHVTAYAPTPAHARAVVVAFVIVTAATAATEANGLSWRHVTQNGARRTERSIWPAPIDIKL